MASSLRADQGIFKDILVQGRNPGDSMSVRKTLLALELEVERLSAENTKLKSRLDAIAPAKDE